LMCFDLQFVLIHAIRHLFVPVRVSDLAYFLEGHCKYEENPDKIGINREP